MPTAGRRLRLRFRLLRQDSRAASEALLLSLLPRLLVRGPGDHEGALASFDAALEIEPHDSFTLAAKAIVLLRLSRLAEAVDVGTQFSSHYSSYFYVQYALAYHLLDSGDLEQAEGMLRQAVAADTTWALGYYSLGCVLNRSGRPRQAVEAYTRAKTLHPTITDVGYESAWLRIAAPPWPVSDDEERAAQPCWEEGRDLMQEWPDFATRKGPLR